jgi:hypothetical protein
MANSSKVTEVKESIAPKVVETQREPDFRGRFNHSDGVYLQVQMGERSLPRLSGRCHGLRKPGKSSEARGF